MIAGPRIAWVVGARARSNLTARYLAACGAALPVAEPPAPSPWNTHWAEDVAVWALSARLCGVEDAIPVPRQRRPDLGDPRWAALPELVGHFRDRATAPVTVFKFGVLPHVWPEIEAALPDAEHVLVLCMRPRAAQVASLLRLCPNVPPEVATEFFDRHDAAAAALVTAFRAAGRLVIEREMTPVGLLRTAVDLGLSPTREAEALWQHRQSS
ncbi:hypothetical protein [Frigoriglobus tundricola]|uniref:Uncharacterized protein n=1 Tax=Frigoriglobus tundricola TaxID=2774151 RepID=A0A6M5YXJ7_9BACT|nr:hypothetical protein [Frigoriglobus tundricola]QJW98705.1 hypothetical protein FTUN_6300 [Frigoriglobus tundricola]